MTQKITLRKHRIFSEEFRHARVKEYEAGQFTVLELSRLHKINPTAVYKWIYRYSAYNKRGIKVVEMADSSQQKLKELQKRISELERVVGQKQLNIDFLEKMIEIAKDQYGIDIKKKSDTPPSSGSEKTLKN